VILCNYSVFCCGSVFTAADCVVEPVILGLPMHVLPIIFPKAHIPVRCENPSVFAISEPQTDEFRTLSPALSQPTILVPVQGFSNSRDDPLVKSYYPLDESYIGCAFVTRVFLYKHPSPIEKTLPLPVSSQYVPNSLTTYTPSPPPHANPFPHPPISRPSLSSYPPIPPPRTPSSRNHNPPQQNPPIHAPTLQPPQTYRLQISTSLHDGYSHAYTSTWHTNHKATV